MKIYITLLKNKEHNVSLPSFHVSTEKPNDTSLRVVELDSGFCVELGRFAFADDLSHIIARHYLISNIDGNPKEELIETYTLPRNK